MFSLIKGKISQSGVVWGSLVVILWITACSFETPAPEHPVKNTKMERVPKTFFINDPVEESGARKPKPFLCAWASEVERGAMGRQSLLNHSSFSTTYCNLEWRIEKAQVVGLEVNPSYPNDPNDRNRWTRIVTIPILRHYYYEREIDREGRKTNRYIKQDQRDAWHHRPYMDIDLNNMRIHNWRSLMTEHDQ